MAKNGERGTRRRVVFAGTAVVVLAVAGAGIWAATRPQPAPQDRAVAARTATLRQTVSSSGTIQPAQQSNLNFGAAGQVTAVNVAVGQQVAAGQALASVTSATLAASVAEANSALAADQAKLTSDSNASAAAAQLTADQAAVTAAQNQLSNAQSALAGATLTAPFAGTVAAVNLTVGQQVSAGGSSSGSASSGSGSGSTGSGSAGQSSGGQGSGGQSSGGGGSAGQGSSGSGSSSSSAAATGQIVIISTGSFIVDASVDDTQVGQVKNGDAAMITPNGSTQNVAGTVTSVGMLAKTSSSVPSYPVTITVSGSPAGLFAGAGAQVSIVVKEVTNAVVVPSAAIHYVNRSPVVYQGSPGAQVAKPITLGMTEGGQTQVLTGLSAGDDVLAPAGSVGRGSGSGGGSRNGSGSGAGNGSGSGGNGSGGNGNGANGSGRGGRGGTGGGGFGGFGGNG